MKKSLIALAVLAASGAAMAQSSVTLYGIADVWVGSVNVDDGKTSTTTTSMISGGVSTSRWGMKGTEDLGGGLKANFGLEQGIGVDGGTVGAGFDRGAWVGLSGNFGEFKMGRVSSPYNDNQWKSNGVFDSDLAPANNPGGGVFRSAEYIYRVDNALYYSTPTMGGFNAAILYSLDEKTAGKFSVTSLALTYAQGPLAAQLAYQAEDKYQTPNTLTYLRLGASYNFGMATAKFTYGALDNVGYVDGAKTSEFQIGVDVPLSAAMTLGASYATSDDNAKAGDAERNGFGVAIAYGLSKRTTLYGGFKMAKIDYTGSTPDTDVTVFAAGVKHSF